MQTHTRESESGRRHQKNLARQGLRIQTELYIKPASLNATIIASLSATIVTKSIIWQSYMCSYLLREASATSSEHDASVNSVRTQRLDCPGAQSN